MATNAFQGGALKLYKVTPGSPDVETPISMEVSLGFSVSRATIDVSNKDGDDWAEYIAGLKSGSLDMTARLDHTPGTGKLGSIATFDLFNSGSIVKWRIKGTVGGKVITLDFEGFVQKHDMTLDNQVAADVNMTIQLTGALDFNIT